MGVRLVDALETRVMEAKYDEAIKSTFTLNAEGGLVYLWIYDRN